MKRTIHLLIACAAIIAVSCSTGGSDKPSAKSVAEVAKRVADWQIENFDNQGEFRAPRSRDSVFTKEPYHDLTWHQGAFYAGLYEYSKIADSDKYTNWLKQMGNKHGWNLHRRMYHADDHTVGQFYLSLAEESGDPAMYQPTQKRFDEIMNSERADEWHWDWCDALFMAPPVWVRLSKITQDPKYLEYMDEQYVMAYDKLWDTEEKLFYRDLKYLSKAEKNGEKMFWSRGDGWVFGGLALMIPDMPVDWKRRDFYINMFQEMAVAIKDCQRPDGAWSAGMLGDLEDYPDMETSGTAFFVYGFAWGLNNGLLDKATYEPVMLKAWSALVSAVNEDGMVGYVQGVGEMPGLCFKDYTEVYGSGAFLAAAKELYLYLEAN